MSCPTEYVTEATLNERVFRFYNESTGVEYFFARQHIVSLVFNGERLTVVPIHGMATHFEPRATYNESVGNDLDRVVTAFDRGTTWEGG